MVGWSARNTTGSPLGGTWIAPVTTPSLGSSPSTARRSGVPSRRRPTRLDSAVTVHPATLVEGGAIVLRLSPQASFEADEAKRLLGCLFGDVPITVAAIAEDGKVLQYTSDLTEDCR